MRKATVAVEALEQGGVVTQEDLGQVLNVSTRTIKRDCKAIQKAGVYIPTRGKLHGIGRGQTHKGQIIKQWLQGKTYDQISRQTHHSTTAIKRYIQMFVRVMELKKREFEESQIALLLQIGEALVEEYLEVNEQNNSPECQERLKEQLERLEGYNKPKRGSS